MLRAATGPWRTACCAVGGQVPPWGSGAAAQSPIAQTESSPCTRRYESTGTRPRSSSGRFSSPRIGWALTPAVPTTGGGGSTPPPGRGGGGGGAPPPRPPQGGGVAGAAPPPPGGGGRPPAG